MPTLIRTLSCRASAITSGERWGDVRQLLLSSNRPNSASGGEFLKEHMTSPIHERSNDSSRTKESFHIQRSHNDAQWPSPSESYRGTSIGFFQLDILLFLRQWKELSDFFFLLVAAWVYPGRSALQSAKQRCRWRVGRIHRECIVT